MDVGRYLARIGVASGADVASLETLAMLQRAHLTHVPFENLDIVGQRPVSTDLEHSIAKIVEHKRGGWCFEVNGAFGALLDALGFTVGLLGAAVLLDGPNKVLDHLALEVTIDQPYLVDVGFGDSFSTPLRLNSADEQDGGTGRFQFIASPQGTTLAKIVDGIPEAQYRFKRVLHNLEDFTPASDALQTDPTLHWSAKPFATRLLDGGPDRVTLLADRLKMRIDGKESTETVGAAGSPAWLAKLDQWFDIPQRVLPDALTSERQAAKAVAQNATEADPGGSASV